MKPQRIGRALGIGVRVAGRLAGQRLGPGAPAGSVSQAASGQGVTSAVRRDAGAVAGGVGEARARGNPQAGAQAAVRSAKRVPGSVARGVGGFLRPFSRVGGIVFLEVAGLFFFLFVLFFGQSLWKMRASAMGGPDHAKFLIAAVLLVVFLYLSGSSFWRARRR